MEYDKQKDPKIIELGNRIRKAIEKSGKSQAEFASLLDIFPSNLNRWIQGENAPAFENLLSIGMLADVSFDWLMTGEGEIEKEGATDRVAERPLTWIRENFVLIPQFSGGIGGGRGQVPEPNVEMLVAFRKDWIQRKGDPLNMSLIKVKGDSMEPTLYQGDLILVDRSKNYFDPSGGIYAVEIGGEIFAKRLDLDLATQKIRVISDNPKSPPMEVHPDQLRINGKVIWFARELER